MTESKTFPGRVISGDDDPLEVEVVVERNRIRMTSSSAEIGAWPVDGCHLERAGDSSFSIGEDGDAVQFEPDDVAGFGEIVEHVTAGTLTGLFGALSSLDSQSAAPGPAEDAGPFEIDVTIAGNTGGEFEIDPGPEDAGIGTGYLETVDEVDVGYLPTKPDPQHASDAPVASDDLAGEALDPEGPGDRSIEDSASHSDDLDSAIGSVDGDVEDGDTTPVDTESDGADHVHPPGEDHLGDDELEPADESGVGEAPVAESDGMGEHTPIEADVEEIDDSGDLADDLAGDPAGVPVGVPAGVEAGDVAGEEDGAGPGVPPSESSLTDRIKELGSAEGDDGAELRRSFGQRLSRRRVGTTPNPPPATVDPAASGSIDADLSAAGSEGTDGADLEGIDLEAISAGVANADPLSDTAALAAAVDALRENTESGDFAGSTVADTILEAQRSLRSTSSKASDLPNRLKKVALFLGVVILLGGLGLGGYLAFQILVAAGPDDPPATTIAAGATTVPPATAAPPTTVPSTTAVPTTTVPRQPTAFELSAPEFVARWNDTADQFNPVLRLPSLLPGDFEFALTPYLAAVGSVAEGGSIGQITLLIDPSGPSESDALGIQAMGMMIAAVDPNLTGPDRKALLAAMGFDVDNPTLVGVDGLSARNGVEYRLVYDNDAVQLRFTASPG